MDGKLHANPPLLIQFTVSEHLKKHTPEIEMEINTHEIKNIKIAELSSEQILINNIDDGLNLLGNVYYQGFDKVVIHQKNITPDFFELKNRMAGEILQKFSTYRVQLAIVGDFSTFNSKSLKDFIYESNKGNQISFVSSTNEAFTKLSGK